MSRNFWTEADIGTLKLLYPDTPTAQLVSLFGRPAASIYRKAAELGLAKRSSYLATPEAGRFQRGDRPGEKTEFHKGHVPANKGLRMPGYARGRMGETQFGKGHRPHNWVSVGSERITDGYLRRKMADTGDPPRDWVAVHRLIWEEANGAIPPGHVVIFVDGDRRNVALSNLRLVSRSELGRQNTMWNRYPRELAETIQLAGALKRKINRKKEPDEKQD